MSEKRFVRIENENGISIKDTDTGYERYYAIEVLDDLNDLNDENRELRRDLENSYGANATLERVIFKLGEMNAQYREQLMKIPESIREVWIDDE